MLKKIEIYIFIEKLRHRTVMTPSRWNNDLAVKALDSQTRGPRSKPLDGSKVDSAFQPSKVNKMSTRNFWELRGKK